MLRCSARSCSWRSACPICSSAGLRSSRARATGARCMLADTLAPLTAGSSTSLARTEALCAHCGEPVPGGKPGGGPLFCCNGCASVYAILQSSGLESYYERRDEVGAHGQAANVTGKAYAELAEPEFERLYCKKLADGRLTTELF